jgi:DNA-binding LytR/AlgR family response regulator
VRPLTVLAVDDEPLALDRVTDLLARLEGVQLVEATTSGVDAIRAIEEKHPDLVLLDIEMPKVDGFDVVETLARAASPAHAPLICFVTAYPQFAANAFDSGALDFLCKPIRLSRLEKAIERARSAIGGREASARLEELSRQVGHLRESVSQPDDQWLWVNGRREMFRLEVAEIDWIEAEGEYVRLHCGPKSYLLRNSISGLTEKLAPAGFLRVHRSAAVKRDKIRGLRRSRAGARIVLGEGVEIPVGRRYRTALRPLFESLSAATTNR